MPSVPLCTYTFIYMRKYIYNVAFSTKDDHNSEVRQRFMVSLFTSAGRAGWLDLTGVAGARREQGDTGLVNVSVSLGRAGRGRLAAQQTAVWRRCGRAPLTSWL